jgi:hypothetical protein
MNAQFMAMSDGQNVEYFRPRRRGYGGLTKVMRKIHGFESPLACPRACPPKSGEGGSPEALWDEGGSNPTQGESNRVAPSRSDLIKDFALIPAAYDRMFPLILAFPEGSDNSMKHESCVLGSFYHDLSRNRLTDNVFQRK